MRLKMFFILENNIIPIQYRKCIISFIKLSLTEYNQEYFKRLYNEKDNIIKPYTFSVFFNNPQFQEENIKLQKNEIQLEISIADYEIGVALYNSFNHQKNKKFSIDKNSMTLKNIEMLNERKIESNEIDIKFISPLIVRNRKNQKDYYCSFNDENFIDILKINIKEELKITNIPNEVVDNFEITPINAKKVIVKFYEKKVETSVGTFKLRADTELLNYLYKAGIGSKRSSGFGMFNII